MNNEQIERGKEQLRLMGGPLGEMKFAKLEQHAPDLAKIVLGFGFGEIYSREGLSIREKEMLSIASLVSQGNTADQLQFHFSAALHAGLSEKEIIEILIHCIPHVGIPKVMNAFHTWGSLLSSMETSN